MVATCQARQEQEKFLREAEEAKQKAGNPEKCRHVSSQSKRENLSCEVQVWYSSLQLATA